MRRLVLMEVVKTDAVDVDGNAVYHPVDGGRGELMWLRKDRVIECADSGPVYRVPKKGDTTISTNPFIPYKAKLDWPYNVHRCLCFPAPEREEKMCCDCKHGELPGDKYPCFPCQKSGEGGNKPYAYWEPRDEPDPAEWCGGALGGVM